MFGLRKLAINKILDHFDLHIYFLENRQAENWPKWQHLPKKCYFMDRTLKIFKRGLLENMSTYPVSLFFIFISSPGALEFQNLMSSLFLMSSDTSSNKSTK